MRLILVFCKIFFSGDIEDFPGLDSLPCFDVKVESGRVKVKAHKGSLKSSKVTKAMASPCGKDSSTFVVVGAGKSLIFYGTVLFNIVSFLELVSILFNFRSCWSMRC